jgi:hypothetical protein
LGIEIDLFLYGELAGYAPARESFGCANTKVTLKEQGTVRELLVDLNLPTEKRGVTFINGKLSAMPGVQPDLEYALADHDRVAFFDLRSMWPFQYRLGAPMVEEMAKAMGDGGAGVHNDYSDKQ